DAAHEVSFNYGQCSISVTPTRTNCTSIARNEKVTWGRLFENSMCAVKELANAGSIRNYTTALPSSGAWFRHRPRCSADQTYAGSSVSKPRHKGARSSRTG